MKTLQTAILTLFITLGLSCQNAKEKSDRDQTKATTPAPDISNSIKKHLYKDAHTGLVVNSKKFPANWNIISRASYNYDKVIPSFSYQIQGPGGLKAFNAMYDAYTYYQNQEYNGVMGNYGVKVRPVPNITTLMEQEFFSKMKTLGFSYLGSVPAADLEEIIRQKIQKQGLNGVHVNILSTKWTNGKGQQALVNLALMQFHNSMPYIGKTITWTYGVDYLIANSDYLESAYVAVKNSIRSEVENPEWLQYKNKLMLQRQQQSTLRHQQRMKANQTQFESHQQYMKGVYANSDANHNAYMKRLRGTDGSDVGHQNYIGMIRDEERVYDSNGQSYTVDSNAKQYWMDSDGNYIKTDDLFYNPNGDINLNYKEWTSLKRNN